MALPDRLGDVEHFTTARNRFLIFWILAVLALWFATWFDAGSYTTIWGTGTTILTFIFGFGFYVYILFKKARSVESKRTRLDDILIYFAIVSLTLLFALYAYPLIGTVTNRFAQWLIGAISFVLCLYFLLIDFLLYQVDSDLYAEEGRLAKYVDLPAVCGLGLVLTLAHLNLPEFDKFATGANAFQLIAFNTAFTASLYLSK